MVRRARSENPREGEHDNITHALRAIAANEGRFLLTAAAIRRIVYGVTGREFRPGSWNMGFRRQIDVLWRPARSDDVAKQTGRDLDARCPGCRFLNESYALRQGVCSHCDTLLEAKTIKHGGETAYVLTDEGRRRLMEDSGYFDPAPYDALAWFENVDFYNIDPTQRRQRTFNRSR